VGARTGERPAAASAVRPAVAGGPSPPVTRCLLTLMPVAPQPWRFHGVVVGPAGESPGGDAVVFGDAYERLVGRAHHRSAGPGGDVDCGQDLGGLLGLQSWDADAVELVGMDAAPAVADTLIRGPQHFDPFAVSVAAGRATEYDRTELGRFPTQPGAEERMVVRI